MQCHRVPETTFVKLANGWVIINVGGGPTDDKPEVILEPPPTPTRPVPSWTSAWPTSRPSTGTGAPRGRYSSPPKDHGREIRCYMRDPDGHLIEVGQTTGALRDR